MSFESEFILEEIEISDSKWGPKMRARIYGDHDKWERSIDLCEWEETHHKNIWGQTWEWDVSPESFSQIEKMTGVEIPQDRLWQQEHHIGLKIEEGDMFMRVTDESEVLREVLENHLSYRVEYWDQNQNQMRHYMESVITDDGIPLGLKEDVGRLLRGISAPHTILDYRERPETGQVEYEWNFPHPLRDYQQRGVDRMLEGPCIVQWPTGAGKTIGSLRAVHDLGLSTIVFTHKIDLIEQWVQEIQSTLGTEPGVVQGDREQWRNITVASIQTVKNIIDRRGAGFRIDDFDCVILDESHHVSADTWLDVALKTRAYYRFGLSATVEEMMVTNEQGLKIVAGIGPNEVKISPEELIEEGYLARPRFEWLDVPGISGPKNSYSSWQDAYRQGITENRDRNQRIVGRLDELISEGRRAIVDVKRIDHGRRLVKEAKDGLVTQMWDPASVDPEFSVTFDPEECSEWPIPVVHDGVLVWGYSPTGDMREAIEMAIREKSDCVMWISGEDPADLREYVLDEFRRGEIDGLISTLLREGVDVPEVDSIILGGGGKSAIQLIQTIGRSLRPEGREESLVIDCDDSGPYIGNHSDKRRQAMRDYYGDYGPDPAVH